MRPRVIHTCMSTVTDPLTGNKTSDPATVLDSVKSFFQHQQAHIGGNKGMENMVTATTYATTLSLNLKLQTTPLYWNPTLA